MSKKNAKTWTVEKQRLNTGGARLYLALYAIGLCAAWMLPTVTAVFLYDGLLPLLLPRTAAMLLAAVAAWGTAAVLFALVTVPVTGGAYFFAYRVYRGAEYDGGRTGFGGIYSLGLRMLWRYLPFLLPIALSFLAIQALSASIEPYFGPLIQLIWLLLLIPVNLLFVCRGLFADRRCLLAFYRVRGASLREAARKSGEVVKHQRKRYRRYFIRLYGQLLLLAPTLGVSWILHGFPMTMMSYFALGEELERQAREDTPCEPYQHSNDQTRTQKV